MVKLVAMGLLRILLYLINNFSLDEVITDLSLSLLAHIFICSMFSIAFYSPVSVILASFTF